MAARAFPPLEGAQRDASDPRGHAWLSASAGTGKTQVIAARVLRLLLSGARPEAILCLTFTRAGAAEMAERVHATLAGWVRMPARRLREELFALGEDNGEAEVAMARRLFAQVLDAPGGMRIETIHAFAQALLAGFPLEAGVTPGFRPLDARGEAVLRHRVLSDLLVAAERGGDLGLIADVQLLSRRLGEEGAQALLARAAKAPDALAELGPREGIEARLRRHFEVPAGDIEPVIADACSDDVFDIELLSRIAAANHEWGTATGAKWIDVIGEWIAGKPAARAAGLAALRLVACTANGDPRKPLKGQLTADPEYDLLCAQLAEHIRVLIDLRLRAELAATLAAALRAGQSFALAYGEAKRVAALVDFDDLIRSAERLLLTPGMGEWVRYKLDRSIDHILVDEAQDTNLQQWRIVDALAGEFFAGAGANPRRRTLFAVGDFKQAIYGFQGTDPAAFSLARERFSIKAQLAQQGIPELALDRSYRSTPPVLDLVDRWLADLGPEAMGLDRATPLHRSARGGAGSVLLWRPINGAQEGVEDDEEGWIDDAKRAFATRLARQIRAWLEEPLWLPGRGRAVRPEDILILVRARSELAALIVARLHAEQVPVAGVDRLRLSAPLAVRDLLAALRFAVQPEDDLTLAALLVSPLFGWSQQQLFDAAHGRGERSLWSRVRDGDAAEGLRGLLAMADFSTPYRFLETILSGPLDGRRRLIERLGEEARDPIDELLGAALDFESDGAPSLQRFLDWFDRDDVEVTRDPSAPLDAVRVMTVHGAKGLQAPIVILADATFDPARTPPRGLRLDIGDATGVPIFRPRKEERIAPLDAVIAEAERREREEHWRLLYVALTRAEEMLVIGGALGPAAKGLPPEQSWYAAVERALGGLGSDWEEDLHWSGVRRYAGAAVTGHAETRLPIEPVGVTAADPLPAWLHQPAPIEARPPRPLAPSSLGADLVADPPPSPALRAAAARGRLLHALFERLPAVASDRRLIVADAWLAASGGVADADLRAEIAAAACAVIADPAFAAIFDPAALAEAPIAAVVGGEVIAGTIDRLLVTEDRVMVVDFKTGRRVPAAVEAAPEHHLRQMAAYVAALEVIFPGRPIAAALLYTAGPRLFALPEGLIALHKPGLISSEQSLSGDG